MNDPNEKQQRIKLVGLFITLPFVLAVPPVLGWLIGSWLDKVLDTAPYFTYLMILFGFFAGFREMIRMLKQYGNGV